MPLIRVCAVKGDKGGVQRLQIAFAQIKALFRQHHDAAPLRGVSSASEESWAASARVRSSTPRAGRKAEAWRLPRVMVPVLSSSRTSTSPAASTARPLVAITLAPSIRLIPATPMADSSPPMVVGIRHTSRATSTVTLTALPLHAEKGQMVAVASRNTSVRAISRIVRAISFGVLRRWAPSHHGDHPVEEGFSRVHAAADHQPVGENACPAGHRGKIATGFTGSPGQTRR